MFWKSNFYVPMSTVFLSANTDLHTKDIVDEKSQSPLFVE